MSEAVRGTVLFPAKHSIAVERSRREMGIGDRYHCPEKGIVCLLHSEIFRLPKHSLSDPGQRIE